MFLPRSCWNPFSNEQCAERQHSRLVVRTIPSGFWEWLTHCRRFQHPSLLASSKPFEWHVLNCCPSRCLPSDLGLISWYLRFVVSRFEPREQCNKWLQLHSLPRGLGVTDVIASSQNRQHGQLVGNSIVNWVCSRKPRGRDVLNCLSSQLSKYLNSWYLNLKKWWRISVHVFLRSYLNSYS